ncbi:hypothetical protein NDU88_007435 [Pleurodeles waltl]|uniref:Uncharacterized protein n=1 Tax=Pleurodeles waltl TaxID=8319 RepID=A0AAV7U147_PLEWA|nr:hypothetical protein NDU88_007435 [Pleurodeles waltl]
MQRGETGGAGEVDLEEGNGLGDCADSRIPVCQKWPTMLVWSGSDSDGRVVEEDDAGTCLGRESPPMQVKPPGRVYGPQEQFLGKVRAGMGGRVPEEGRGRDEWRLPRQAVCGSAALKQREGGPRVGSWMESPEDGILKNMARDAPRGRWDGRGCAPTGAFFPGEQRLGSSAGCRARWVAPAVRYEVGEFMVSEETGGIESGRTLG